MIATRLAKAAAVTTLAFGAVLLVPGTANATPSVTPAGTHAASLSGAAAQG
jgi:hypothetical protein